MYILGIETSCDDTCMGIIKVENDHWSTLGNYR